MFAYLVNVKEGVHWDWECGVPFFFCLFFFFNTDCTLLTDMPSILTLLYNAFFQLSFFLMAPNFLALATTLENLGARWPLAKKVNFVPWLCEKQHLEVIFCDMCNKCQVIWTVRIN